MITREDASEGWFYQSEGKQLGPVEPAVLRRLADGGIVKPDTPVRKGADGPGVAAAAVRIVAAAAKR